MKPNFVIQTRQKDDILYRIAATDIAAAGSATLPVRKVIGYGVIRFLAFSDDTLVLRIEQGPTKNGPWVETDRLPSVASPGGSQQMVCGAVSPCAPFMRGFLDNTGGGTEEVELVGSGHPVAAGGGHSGGGGGPATVVEIEDGNGGITRGSVKVDGTAIGAQGSFLAGGRDPSGDQRALPLNAAGELIVSGSGITPGTIITSPADVAVGIGATVALPAPPVGTSRMVAQVTSGDSTTRMRVRELGGAAGAGTLLIRFGTRAYGGADGAIAPIEIENVAGPAASAGIQFED